MRSGSFLAAIAGLAAVLGMASPAAADTTGTGANGQWLTVSKTTGLDPAGETVTVSGSGYDVTKGIYVAFCVDKGAGQLPSPCGGGIDTTGGSGASHWISSNPPAYGEGLAVPYGTGGTFRVTLRLSAALADGVDCRTTRCAVATRADHTRTSDRTQDARVPATFATTGPPPPATTAPAARATTRAATGSAQAPATGSASAPPAVESGALPPSGAPAPAGPADLTLTRTSASQSANHWWTALTAATGLGLLVLVIRAAVRRRRTRKAAA
ncbi:hypothetical protein [Dactylosporangium sp. CA-233914]|uniref:hypothetical protein n=1 Tax=Dactylosporangium sp. CA-233914 TaxID=3239934 RepID=UPI003D8B567A